MHHGLDTPRPAPAYWLSASLVALAFACATPPAYALQIGGRIQATDPAWDGVRQASASASPDKAAVLDAASREASEPTAWLPATLVLPWGQALVDVHATVHGTGQPLVAEALGTTGDHGYQVGFLRVRRPATGAPIVVDVEGTTAPGAVLPVVRRRFDSEQDRRLRASLRRRLANPEALDDPAFAPPVETRKSKRVASAEGTRGFHPTADPSLDGSGVRYLIVTTDALAPAFQPLADWKTRRGMPTAIRTLEWIESRTRHGVDTAETLRNFLVEAYSLWGIEYVLLGGDTEVIPARYAYSTTLGGGTTPTDMYYACLDGNWNADGDALWGEGSPTLNPSESDIYPELAVGRATVNDLTQTQIFTTRVIDYESPVFTDYQQRFTFLTEVLVPANWDSGMTWSYDGAPTTEQIISQSLPPEIQPQRLYDTHWLYPGSEKLRKATALSAMNSGVGFVNHLGHGFRYTMSCGDASLVNADADALGNGGRRFVLLMLNCAAVAFDYNCLAERFLLNPGGGAAAVIGAARSVGANYVTIYNRAYDRQLFEYGQVHLAETLNEMRLERAPLAELESGDRWIQFCLNALGDPEMTIFTGPVRMATLAHAETLVTDPDTLQVHVSVDSLPVSTVNVCAFKDGEVYAAGTTDSMGAVRLGIEPRTAGPLYLTISGQNLMSRTDTLQVVPSTGPVLALDTVTIGDDSLGASDGNGNGSVDAGETVELLVAIRNLGVAAADSVIGSLSSPDSGFVVLQGALEVGDVGPSQSASAILPLVVQVAPGVADGKSLDLPLALQDAAGGHWSERVHLLVCAPRPEVTRVQLVPPDSTGAVQLSIEVKNYGSGDLAGLVATVLPPDSTVVVMQDSTQYATLPQLGSELGVPPLVIAPADTGVALTPVDVHFVDARNRSFQVHVDLVPPPAPGLPTADLTTGANTVRLTWPVSSAPDHFGYHVFRAPTGTTDFQRVTVDLVHHTDYHDTSVMSSSAYRYTIVDVDSSLQWSADSPILDVNTTAASFPGYPIEMSDPTATSVAIGDLDGDTAPEIVVGSVGVYAWHANGVEVIDGDNSGSTNGVFSLAPGTMNASVALAPIDSLPGLEVVAASWLTNRIYVWNGQGQLLPGWPVEPASGGNAGYWASPCVGDLDGDGHMEIVAVSKDGYLYAWHDDGTPLLPATNGAVRQVGAWTQTTPALADLDGDGHLEMVVSGALAQVFVIRDDGTDFPGWPFTLYALGKGSPAIGDVDGDGNLEIVITSESDHLYVLSRNGVPLPGWPKVVPGDAPDFGPSPALGDLDGDGRLEIVVCAVKGPAPFTQTKIYAYDVDGNTVFVKQLELNSQSSPILADLDGDGGIDIVHGGEIGSLHAWNLSGQELAGFPIPIGDYIRGTPTYCDLDLDGKGDLVLAGWNARVYAWKMNGPYRPERAPWPTFHGNIARTGFLRPSYPTTVGEVPAVSRLAAAWSPNPFNPAITLRLAVPGTAVVAGKTGIEAPAAGGSAAGASDVGAGTVPVRVAIYDPRGRLVRSLVDAPLQPGNHVLRWDGRDGSGHALGSGVYFYEVRAGDERVAGKLTLIR